MMSYLLSSTSSASERCSLLSAADVNDMTEELASESLQSDCDVRIKFSGDTTRVLFCDCDFFDERGTYDYIWRTHH